MEDQFGAPFRTLDQFWRCPICESEIGAGRPGKLYPPKCACGHKATEMEQVTAAAFMAEP